VNIRELGPDDDLGALVDLSHRAFGPISSAWRPHWQAAAEESIAAGRYLAAFDGQRMIAAAHYHDMIQWWNGRPVPMAGAASVTVAPEDRGRGTGRALVTALLSMMAGRGFPLSVLYPATSTVYRSVGWEIAGECDSVRIPARSLRSLVAPDPALAAAALYAAAPDAGGAAAAAAAAGLPDAGGPGMRRCGPADAAEVLAVVGSAHEALRDSGPNTRDEATIRRWLSDESVFAYLAPDGFLAYRWQHGNDELLVERAVAISAATTRAMWGIVASHSSIASTVRAHVGPADPVNWLTREPDVAVGHRSPWMLRVVDAAAAVAGRGFPPATEVTAALRVRDAACPGNEGLWSLRVSGGKGALTRGEPASAAEPAVLTLGARGLAALYAGTPLATLRRAGLAAGGDPAADAALDGAFTARPFLLEHF
jgi:predicted acetyltransferase